MDGGPVLSSLDLAAMNESEVSPLSLNRLSLYLRCLRQLEIEGVSRISSKLLAERFHLSAALIRKDLAQFGEFGIRGIGYEVKPLIERLNEVLGLDREHRLIVVGMGHLGVALARYLEFNQGSFKVVAGLDIDPKKVGHQVGHLTIRHFNEVADIVDETEADIALLTVPPEDAQTICDRLTGAGVRAILNFAPVQLAVETAIPTKSVDVRIHLEELAYFLRT